MRLFQQTSTHALIAGGGTGGHIYPALAIADALVDAGHDKSTIRFVGSRRALEARVVPEAGYEIKLLPGRGIKRKLALQNVAAIAGLVAAFFQAVVLCLKLRPNVVVSVGGYAAAPAAFAAVLLQIPLVLSETNAVPGAVNKLVGRFAAGSAIAWPDTPLPKATVTGAPVREEMSRIDRSRKGRDAARASLGIPEGRKMVALFGGSLGARSINRAAHDLAERWAARDDLAIYHVVGSRDFEDEALRAAGSDKGLFAKAVEYEHNMPALYAAADVVVCRAGAITTAEVAATGVPAVFVPLPNAPGDHQTANAQALVRVGGAKLVTDSECDGEHLALMLGPMLDDEAGLEAMAVEAASLGKPDAAARTAELVDSCAR